MPFYTGRSADGSDMQEVEGMYLSSCGKFWGAEPFTPESEKDLREYAKRREWKERIKNLRNKK